MPVLGLSFLLADSRLLFPLGIPKHLHHTQAFKLPHRPVSQMKVQISSLRSEASSQSSVQIKSLPA